MRIACPRCDATYEVPASRLTPGKQVRCTRCDNTWLPVYPPEDAVAPEQSGAEQSAPEQSAPAQSAPAQSAMATPDAAMTAGVAEAAAADGGVGAASTPAPPMVTAMDRLGAPAPAQRPRHGLIGAWVVTFAVLAAAVAATLVWRDAVVRAWPPSGRILETSGSGSAAPAHTPAGQTSAGQTSAGQTSAGQTAATKP